MAQIQRIKTGDTNWGDEATKLNTNFNQLNQNKVEVVPGSRLITEEEAQKLNDLQNLEQPNLNETDPSSFAYVKGQEKIQLIMKAQELQNPPTSSTLTYQVNGETFSYKIGQFVRAIVDGEPKIYQLYNIVNSSAVWKETNTGSGGGGEVSGYAEGFSWYELTNPGDIKPVNGITLSKSLVTYTVTESGITGDTTNIYSLIVWDPTDATDKTVTYKASAGLTVEIHEGVIANITAEPGDYTITITTVEGSHTATLNVKIQPLEPANVPVESIVSKSEVEIDTNNEGGIDLSQYITVFPDNATDKSVTYEISSSDSKYATVSSSGIVTAKSTNGSFTVKVKSVSNPEVVATINMEAYTTLTGISKLNDMVIEGQNQSATFRISIIPTYANRYDPFTVQSLNPDIASVRDSGDDTYTVTSVGLGTTQISVTNGPISEQFDVTVQRANISVKKITLSEQNKSMISDDEFTLTATVEPTDATEEIDWSVTPSDLLAVSYPNNKTANITALSKVGTAIVSAANKDRSSVATCTIQCRGGGISVVSLNFQSVQGSHNLCVVSILKYPNKTARENSRDDYGDFTPTPQSTWIIQNSTESTVMSVTISGEECLGINQVANNAIWRIDGVFQSGRTGTVDCDNELHSIQFNGG